MENSNDNQQYKSSTSFRSSSEWDEIANKLQQNNGMATVELPPSLSNRIANAFRVARHALDTINNNNNDLEKKIKLPIIQQGANAASVTGYHSAGGKGSLSRYNEYREGFIFSNADMFDISFGSKEEESEYNFQNAMEEMFHVMHNDIATHILEAIERKIIMSPPPPITTTPSSSSSSSIMNSEIHKNSKEEKEGESWFQDKLGPTSTSSQWHIKRYVAPQPTQITPSLSSSQQQQQQQGKLENNDQGTKNAVLLPIHTDPSLISIVIHDKVGKNDGAMGLQYQSSSSINTTATNTPAKMTRRIKNDNNNASDQDTDGELNLSPQQQQCEWKEVPHHGHSIATIFIGSVLSYLTGGFYPSCKHRVVVVPSSSSSSFVPEETRMAATLFVRPQYNAKLCIPPNSCSYLLNHVKIKNVTFGVWSERVARNYAKQKKKKKK